MLAVSMSWVALYTFTPAGDRPYISGSTDDNAIAMVFGYNGLSRFGIQIPGAATGSDLQFGPGGVQIVNPGRPTGTPHDTPPGGAPQPAPGSAPAPSAGVQHALGGNTAAGAAGASGRAKLLGGRFGAQIGWLYPLALLALAYGLVRYRRAPRTDPVRGGLVSWGTWLITFGAVFSAMGTVPHTAYIAALAPPLAALSAAGITLAWRAYRVGGRTAWLLPVVVLAELAWDGWLWSGYAGFLPWAWWTVAAVGIATIAVLLAGLLNRPRSRTVTTALVTAVAAALAAPAIWSVSVLDVKYAGTEYDASAGPAEVTTGTQTPTPACGPDSAGSNPVPCP
jgi:4-amino-4-deoxy-L-arabinose transferase-like glycosyltransferase